MAMVEIKRNTNFMAFCLFIDSKSELANYRTITYKSKLLVLLVLKHTQEYAKVKNIQLLPSGQTGGK